MYSSFGFPNKRFGHKDTINDGFSAVFNDPIENLRGIDLQSKETPLIFITPLKISWPELTKTTSRSFLFETN